MPREGYYLYHMDETTCGGRILSGASDETIDTPRGVRERVREGDPVTCGKHAGRFRVCGGMGDTYEVNGVNRQWAGSIESYSSCPCKAKFNPSVDWDTYDYNCNSALAAERAETAKRKAEQEPVQHAQEAKKPQPEKQLGIDAGFAVIPYGGTTEGWQRLLFTGQPPAGAEALFASLNVSGQEYKAGSIMLIVDPTRQNAEQINHMKAAKARIDAALAPLTHQEANFLHRHYATIANFSSFADKGIGLAADPVGKYFENIEKTLKEIQETYKNTYITRGALIGDQFYIRRSKLFKELESVLKVGFLNKAMKLGEYTKIKTALGLSTSSITHKWNQTGVGDIDGYATHIERAAKYIKAMKYAGYVGIGFSGLHSLNEINEACSVGRESECTKKKYTEIGSFTLSTGGGVGGGYLAIPLCVAIGMGTAGVGGLACVVIAGAGLGYAGSSAGEAFGEWSGEKLYETFGN